MMMDYFRGLLLLPLALLFLRGRLSKLGVLLLLGVFFSLAFFSSAMAATFREEYIPPEVAYAHHLQYRLRAPGKVNLNQASLQELQCLPGVDESVGLKLMRLRPLKSFEDFQQLPYTDAKAVQRLIERLRTYVEF